MTLILSVAEFWQRILDDTGLWRIKSTLLNDIYRKDCRLWEIQKNTNIFSERLNLDWLWNSWCCFSSVASFRDADGDVDTCPMWTFPTVRPTSMNKLQKGYTHTDSEVRPRSDTCTYYLFSFPLKAFFPVCSQAIQWKDNPSLNLCLLWSRPFSER